VAEVVPSAKESEVSSDWMVGNYLVVISCFFTNSENCSNFDRCCCSSYYHVHGHKYVFHLLYFPNQWICYFHRYVEV
jgi:hypothetical protein